MAGDSWLNSQANGDSAGIKSAPIYLKYAKQGRNCSFLYIMTKAKFWIVNVLQ